MLFCHDRLSVIRTASDKFNVIVKPTNPDVALTGNNLGNLTSNLELQFDGGEWLMVPITAADPATSTVTATLPAGKTRATAVRYAWYDNPACPAAYDHFHVSAEPYWCLDSSYDPSKQGAGYDATNMCALYSTPSDLPAVPFSYPLAGTPEGIKCSME